MPYDETKADRVVKFIQNLKCTQGRQWVGKNLILTPWQEHEVIRPFFGTVKEDGFRQYRFCYIEVPKKSGKTELAGAVADYCLYADSEWGAEVYSAAGDREQASKTFNAAAQMVRQNPKLLARTDIIDSRKRMVVHKTNSFFAALSRETFTKHGYNPSCIVIDEMHAHKNREMYDVLVEGTDTARRQQVVFIITTAGIYDKKSIAWELHDYAMKVKQGIIDDPTFLPVIYAVDKEENWASEKVWRKANPSVDILFGIDKIREHYDQVKNIPSRENNFRRFRLNQWVSQVTRWMPMQEWEACGEEKINIESLKGRTCYGGLDLSFTTDITAYVLVFPPEDEEGVYKVLCYFWIPEENMQERARRDKVPYDMWVRAGLIEATPGNVIDYSFIKAAIEMTAEMFDVEEIAYDRAGATKIVQDLEELGFITTPTDAVDKGSVSGKRLIPFGQGYLSMGAPMKDLLHLILSRKINHGGNPVLRWMADNVVVRMDPAGGIKPDKERSLEKIDGIVALIMGLDRARKHKKRSSVYEERGVLTF
jgi:phage terminase large subunit-like protein